MLSDVAGIKIDQTWHTCFCDDKKGENWISTDGVKKLVRGSQF